MRLTCEKKIVSNWSWTRLRADAEAASSSTVPMIASCELVYDAAIEYWSLDVPSELQHSTMSIRPKASTTSATAAPHWPILRPSAWIVRIRAFQPLRSGSSLSHSAMRLRRSRLRVGSSSSCCDRHAATESPCASKRRMRRTTSGEQPWEMNQTRGLFVVAAESLDGWPCFCCGLEGAAAGGGDDIPRDGRGGGAVAYGKDVDGFGRTWNGRQAGDSPPASRRVVGLDRKPVLPKYRSGGRGGATPPADGGERLRRNLRRDGLGRSQRCSRPDWALSGSATGA